MSNESCKQDEVKTSSTVNNAFASASQFAVQVALQTLKERCQKLQSRLTNLEQENMQLKVEKQKLELLVNSKGESNCLEDTSSEMQHFIDEIANLSKQKSQLTHHIHMVASENKSLWNRLSRLTQANENLGNHLEKISNTLNRHSSSSNLCSNSEKITQKGPASEGTDTSNLSSINLKSSSQSLNSKEKSSIESIVPALLADKDHSVEEMSIKLINSFLQEKNELEEQCAQMTEIQTTCSGITVPTVGFSYLDDVDESAVDDIKLHCEKLYKMKEELIQQQLLLKSVMSKVKYIKSDTTTCVHCMKQSQIDKMEDLETQREVEGLRMWASGDGSYSTEIQSHLDQVAEPPVATEEVIEYSKNGDILKTDSICPFCEKKYAKLSKFDDFTRHVLKHFPEDIDDGSFIATYEVVPKKVGI